MYQRRLVSSVILLAIPLLYGPAVYAAKAIDLNQQNVSILQKLLHTRSLMQPQVNLEETRRSVDFKKTLHVRFQETYAGVPIWGADGILHIPNGDNKATGFQSAIALAGKAKGSMDGKLYDDLRKDLAETSKIVFTDAQKEKATRQAINDYKTKVAANPEVKDLQNKLIVFVDDAGKAHFAYHVSFYASPTKAGAIPAMPNFIMDAVTFQVYVTWDNIKTLENVATFGGGYGGNLKMGQLVYDGLEKNFPKLNIIRDDVANLCYLQNPDVKVKKCTSYSWGQCRASKDFSVPCDKPDEAHNGVYWNGDLDKVNGGYSPSNDALFNGAVIKDLYQKWYNVPVLESNGKPMLLVMVVHLPMDNAYWDGSTMNFGDGINYFYPLTSLGVAAHEISHGFTEQHSALAYYGQSGGLNESYSDMAAQAAEQYAFEKNSWQIGPEIFKAQDRALRYMDQPSKDCQGGAPGDSCSIDSADQYYSGLDVHYSSGVYNHLFYLLGTTDGWTVRKAFDVMVHANSNYWTSSVSFSDAGCGILKAAKDLGYSTADVQKALDGVKVKPSCTV